MKGRKEEEGTMAGEPFEGDESKKAESPVAAAAAPATATLEEKTKATSSEATRAATPSSTAAAGEAAASGEGAGGEAKAPGDEEDTGAQIAPIVRLEEVVISTGEENEDVLSDLKSKLYRFDKDGNQWKERGVGQVKLLQHKETKKVRLLMRQSRTLKICANHLVLPSMNLQEHAGSEKSWVWHATDFSEGELKNELFCIRLGSVENAQKFKSAFEEAQDKTGKAERPDVKADDAVKALGGLSLGDKSNKESTEQPAVESSA